MALGRRAVTALGLGLVVVSLVPHVTGATYQHDEFTLMSAALRMTHGDVLYRDFFEFWAPLSMFLLAVAYKLFGATFFVTRLVIGAAMALAAWQIVRILRRFAVAEGLAWLTALGLSIALFGHWSTFSHHWIAVPFELGALELALVGLASEAGWPWLLAGCLMAGGGLSVQTSGVVTSLAVGAGIVLAAVADRRFGLGLKRLAWVGVGIAAVLGLAAGVLAGYGALGAAFEDVVMWPLRFYRPAGGYNDVPVGVDLLDKLAPITAVPGWYVRAYQVLATYALMGFTAAGAAAWGLSRLWRQNRRPDDVAVGLVAAWVLSSSYIFAHGRSDYIHMSIHAVPALVLAAIGIQRFARSEPAWIRRAPAFALLLFVLSGAVMGLNGMRKDAYKWAHPLDPDRSFREEPIIRYIQAHAKPGDTLTGMAYGGFFYFYTGLAPASSYSLLLPVELGYGAQAQMDAAWQEVAEKRPRWVVVSIWPFKAWEDSLAYYTDRLPAGYELVGKFVTPQFGDYAPASLYEDRRAR